MKQIYATSAPGGGGGTPVTPAALTKTDDTNVTLTLGGTPATALLQAVSITVGWTGTLADARIASAAYWNAKEPAITAGTVSQYWRGDKTWQTFPTIPTVTPAALTKVDDTNVTITLGGTPATSLLQAVSLTVGWSGTLADSRIASASIWDNAGEWKTLIGKVLSPADSTIYYMPFGGNLAPAATTAARAWKFTKSGSVLNVLIGVNQSANGSSEPVTIYLRNITTGTDNLCGTFTLDGGVNANTFANFSVSIPINTTDLWAIKILTPAWVTNPTNCYFTAQIFNKS